MRPTTTWLLGCVLGGALASCSGDPAAGPCVRQSDCGDGQRCHPDLGCVPFGNGDGDADSDSDTDADGDAEGCEAARQQDCLLPDDCDSLWARCDQGDREACAALEAGACEADRCGAEDDACEPQCPPDDPDCPEA